MLFAYARRVYDKRQSTWLRLREAGTAFTWKCADHCHAGSRSEPRYLAELGPLRDDPVQARGCESYRQCVCNVDLCCCRFISRSGNNANGSHRPAYGLAAIDPNRPGEVFGTKSKRSFAALTPYCSVLVGRPANRVPLEALRSALRISLARRGTPHNFPRLYLRQSRSNRGARTCPWAPGSPIRHLDLCHL
jgi:hypothetical protein